MRKNMLNISWRKFAAGLLICGLITVLFAGCSLESGGTEQPTVTTEQIENHYNDQVRELYSKLIESLPENCTSSVPEVSSLAVSDSSVMQISGTDIFEVDMLEAQFERNKIAILRPVCLAVLTEQSAYAIELAGKDGSAAVTETVGIITDEINQAESVKSLYSCMLSAEERLFCSVSELSADNRKQMKVLPVLYLDDQQQVWLRFYTNFAVPGFSDNETGFSLRLLLENGKLAQADADSIYAYENIVHEGAYAVRFNLSRMLTTVSTEDFFSGRSRIVFSVFSKENDFGFSQDFYRMSDASMTTGNNAEDYLSLLCILAEYS